MVDCILLRNNEHYGAYRLLLVIIMAIAPCVPHAITSEAESVVVDCSEFKNCANCTDKSTCGWSLEKQSCESATFPSVNELSVRNRTQCPRLSVVGKSSVTDVPFNYTVRISNDAVGFKRFLRKTRIRCCFHSCEEFSVDGRMVGDDLVCNEVEAPSSHLLKHSLKTTFYHVYISAGGARLRLDDELDHYYNIYARDCNRKEDDDCVTCLWNANGYRYYMKWCSSRNQCVGLSQYFEKRDVDDITRISATDDTETIACADLRIRSFDPAFGPFAGNVGMRINVKNHWVAVDNRTMTVTVAGRWCADPMTIDRETIGCTVRWTNGTGPDSGPVEVAYASTFKLTSGESFEFAEPVVTGVRPACGPTGGGTRLTVTGNRLDVGRTVRVSVGENVTCDAVSRESDRITCVTGPGVADTAAGATVQFDGAVSRDAPSPAFAYAAEPTVDAGQSFASIATGGTTVPVRGRRFSCVERPEMHADHRGVRHYAGCRVRNDSYMECRSPEIGSLSSETTPARLRFGFRVRFGGRVVDVSPEPEPPHLSFHPDPLFEDFEIDGNAVVVNGRDMNRGYRVDDLAVRLSNHSDADCVVTSVTRHRIECTPTSPRALDNDLRVIVVTIGDKFVRNVKKKTTIFAEIFRYLFVATNFGIILALIIAFTCVLMICGTNQIVRRRYV